MCMRNTQFLCIPAYVARLVVVLGDQLHEAAAYQFAFRQGNLVIMPAFVDDGDTRMNVSI